MKPMHLLVLVKEVPDMNRVQFDHDRGVIDRSSAQAELNPFDCNALQAAVNLKKTLVEAGGSCQITALTMGPNGAGEMLRDVYARGADRLVLLTDRRFGGADTLATAHTLAAAARWLGEIDVIFCGEKTVDGDTAQVGPEVAQLLDIPHCCYVDALEAGETALTATVGELQGQRQTRQLDYPCLLTVTKNAAIPVLPTLKRKLESRKIDITTLGLDDLAPWVSDEQVGAKGSPTRVSKIEIPKPQVREARIFRQYSAFAPVWQAQIRQYR